MQEVNTKQCPVTSIEQILAYEVGSSWWASWISNDRLQSFAAWYFAWKAKRKYRRYCRYSRKLTRAISEMKSRSDPMAEVAYAASLEAPDGITKHGEVVE